MNTDRILNEHRDRAYQASQATFESLGKARGHLEDALAESLWLTNSGGVHQQIHKLIDRITHIRLDIITEESK